MTRASGLGPEPVKGVLEVPNQIEILKVEILSLGDKIVDLGKRLEPILAKRDIPADGGDAIAKVLLCDHAEQIKDMSRSVARMNQILSDLLYDLQI